MMDAGALNAWFCPTCRALTIVRPAEHKHIWKCPCGWTAPPGADIATLLAHKPECPEWNRSSDGEGTQGSPDGVRGSRGAELRADVPSSGATPPGRFVGGAAQGAGTEVPRAQEVAPSATEKPAEHHPLDQCICGHLFEVHSWASTYCGRCPCEKFVLLRKHRSAAEKTSDVEGEAPERGVEVQAGEPASPEAGEAQGSGTAVPALSASEPEATSDGFPEPPDFYNSDQRVCFFTGVNAALKAVKERSAPGPEVDGEVSPGDCPHSLVKPTCVFCGTRVDLTEKASHDAGAES